MTCRIERIAIAHAQKKQRQAMTDAIDTVIHAIRKSRARALRSGADIEMVELNIFWSKTACLS